MLARRGLLLGSDDLQRYGIDRTTLWQAAPCAVVLPATVEEVRAIVLLAREHGLAIVPSGGRTGLSGGAVAKDGELVVAMDRFDKILEFNPLDRSITVGAGVVTAQLQQFAGDRGCFMGWISLPRAQVRLAATSRLMPVVSGSLNTV